MTERLRESHEVIYNANEFKLAEDGRLWLSFHHSTAADGSADE